jgi:hypothetical protein
MALHLNRCGFPTVVDVRGMIDGDDFERAAYAFTMSSVPIYYDKNFASCQAKIVFGDDKTLACCRLVKPKIPAEVDHLYQNPASRRALEMHAKTSIL